MNADRKTVVLDPPDTLLAGLAVSGCRVTRHSEALADRARSRGWLHRPTGRRADLCLLRLLPIAPGEIRFEAIYDGGIRSGCGLHLGKLKGPRAVPDLDLSPGP